MADGVFVDAVDGMNTDENGAKSDKDERALKRGWNDRNSSGDEEVVIGKKEWEELKGDVKNILQTVTLLTESLRRVNERLDRMEDRMERMESGMKRQEVEVKKVKEDVVEVKECT